MLHIYTGNGKGKTTSAIGQLVRYIGYGKRAVFAQFLKTTQTGEVLFFKENCCQNIEVLRPEKVFPFSNKMSEEQMDEIKEIHNNILKEVISLSQKEEYGMIVLDEIISTYNLGLINKEVVKKFLLENVNNKEIIITGRDCPKEFLELADYVSDINCVKNPFDKGVVARKGIEY